MKRFKYIFFLIFISFLEKSPLFADSIFGEDVKPIVLILLDTSGSMEYTEDGVSGEVGDEHKDGVPPGTPQYCEGAEYKKSRFILALEFLTGTIKDYWCSYDEREDPQREDFKFIVPHVVPNSKDSNKIIQLNNGLIDINKSTIKFGLMTYDNVLNDGNGPEGGYSYGDEKGVNIGARNLNAKMGKLVIPAQKEEVDVIIERNNEVEDVIKNVIPYGGSPIAPILYDALYLFNNDDSLKPYDKNNKKGDLYYNCRSKNIILITDGIPTMGEGNNGYQTSTQIANQLYLQGINVYVVGFNLAVGVASKLKLLAMAGGTNDPYIVSNPYELAKAFSQILVKVSQKARAKTMAVSTKNTQNRKDALYIFDASYTSVVENFPVIKGILERSIYRCPYDCAPVSEFGGPKICEVNSLGEKLTNTLDGERKIFTVIDGYLNNFSVTNSYITPDLLNIPKDGELINISPEIVNEKKVCGKGILGDAESPEVRNQYKDNLIKFIRAADDSCRADYKLGGIGHSTPSIQTNFENTFSTIQSFNIFKEKIKDRPTVLYVGTNDGLLHAFRVDRKQGISSGDDGKELWAFIPFHLLPKLNSLTKSAIFLIDGSPVVRDILLKRTKDSVKNPKVEAEYWKTILVSGYRGGGRGYFALDVTDPDPEDFKFMWEIGHNGRCYKPSVGFPQCFDSSMEENNFEKLGLSYSTPSIGNIYIEHEGSLEEIAVAVFGGGDNEGIEPEFPGSFPFPGPHPFKGKGLIKDAGKVLYVVKLETGEKIAELSNNKGNVIDAGSLKPGDGLDYPLIGSPACFNTALASFISRCYIGDKKGQLWRVDLSSKYPSNWRLYFFFDPWTLKTPLIEWKFREGVYEKPSLSVAPNLIDLVIVYGTGDIDNLGDLKNQNFVISLNEERVFKKTGELEKIAAFANWVKFLDEGEKMIGEPTTFSKVAYWTTFIPDVEDSCSSGKGRIWGGDYIGNVKNSVSDIIPALDQDGDPLTQDLVSYIEYEKIVPYGIDIIKMPSCIGGKPFDYESIQGGGAGKEIKSVEGGKPTLYTKTQNPEIQSGETIPSGVSPKPQIPKLSIKLGAVHKKVVVSSWGLVFD